jgi:hypothetical protein
MPTKKQLQNRIKYLEARVEALTKDRDAWRQMTAKYFDLMTERALTHRAEGQGRVLPFKIHGGGK